jgi:hypothetical protein
LAIHRDRRWLRTRGRGEGLDAEAIVGGIIARRIEMTQKALTLACSSGSLGWGPAACRASPAARRALRFS